MITAALLTLEEYHRRYAGEHGAEYWFGELRYKNAPAWLHGLLQVLLGEILTRLRYAAGSEVELRIDPHWEPKPDVIAARKICGSYPTAPNDVALVCEVRSPDDTDKEVLAKCYQYGRVGIQHIYVFDPEQRTAHVWNAQTNQLDAIYQVWQLPDGDTVPLSGIWDELYRRAGAEK